MKVIVKDEKCIGCGSCVSMTDGEIFDFNEETGKACLKVETIKENDEDLVKKSMEFCPTAAIVETNNDTEE